MSFPENDERLADREAQEREADDRTDERNFSFKVVDAADDTTERTVTIKPDRHGCVIEFEGCEDEGIVIDFARSKFRVFRHNECGEVGEALTEFKENKAE